MTMATLIAKAAVAAGISPALLLSVCFQESSFLNQVRPVDGNSASYGVCMVKQLTARFVANKYHLDMGTHPSHLLDPSLNALYAALYLKYQLKRYEGNEACAVNAYNKGHTTACNMGTNSKYVQQIRKHMKEQPWKH